MLNVNELFVKNPVVININSVNGINTVNPLTLPCSTREGHVEARRFGEAIERQGCVALCTPPGDVATLCAPSVTPSEPWACGQRQGQRRLMRTRTRDPPTRMQLTRAAAYHTRYRVKK